MSRAKENPATMASAKTAPPVTPALKKSELNGVPAQPVVAPQPSGPQSTGPQSTGPQSTESVEVTPTVGFGWVMDGIRPYLGYLFIAAGLIAIFIGWYGAAGQSVVAKQIPYIASGGLLGVVLIAIGNRVFMIVAELHAVLLARSDAEQGTFATASAVTDAKPYRAVARGTIYHLPTCTMVDGKNAVSISKGDVTSRGLKPCRICTPDAAGK
jgi:hypothetical protein